MEVVDRARADRAGVERPAVRLARLPAREAPTRSCSRRSCATVGIGAGQMSRVDSVRLAIEKARAATRCRAPCWPPTRSSRSPTAPSWRSRRGVTRDRSSPAGSVRDAEVDRGGRRGRRRDGLHAAAPLPPLASDGRSSGIGSGGPWEPVVGYSPRRPGGRSWCVVAGTTALDGRRRDRAGLGDRTSRRPRRWRTSWPRWRGSAPGSGDVIRTRMFVTDISRWEELRARARRGLRRRSARSTAMVGVAALIDPRMLVEIEADAFLTRGSPGRDVPGPSGDLPRDPSGASPQHAAVRAHRPPSPVRRPAGWQQRALVAMRTWDGGPVPASPPPPAPGKTRPALEFARELLRQRRGRSASPSSARRRR